ncbi:hypothetical protein IHE45_07G063900 [Dioscorea alata]|uniref:Uncharacterized protein n=1 Tax=Dioscorea alata TaxID=55571 RepID=A0ACB7VS22_DIOAL|nr:hypothetical protein IHE45_07G063900 [Dioscorea alata]
MTTTNGRKILTRNYLYVKISMTRAIAQLGRAPHLHVCQCFSKDFSYTMNIIHLIEMKIRCLTP